MYLPQQSVLPFLRLFFVVVPRRFALSKVLRIRSFLDSLVNESRRQLKDHRYLQDSGGFPVPPNAKDTLPDLVVDGGEIGDAHFVLYEVLQLNAQCFQIIYPVQEESAHASS